MLADHPAAGAGVGPDDLTAGPVVRAVMSYLLQKYAVAPDGTKPPKAALTW